MRRDEALAVLAAHRKELERLGVTSLAVFGSVARDEARPDSDVDILVELRRPMGLFGFLDIKDYLEQILGRKVDLVTRGALKRQLRERILAEAIDAA
jgi:predicted nucleotidyltransferase